MFDMLECKSMATPMDTHLKLLVDSSLELVDVTLYRKMIVLALRIAPKGYGKADLEATAKPL